MRIEGAPLDTLLGKLDSSDVQLLEP